MISRRGFIQAVMTALGAIMLPISTLIRVPDDDDVILNVGHSNSRTVLWAGDSSDWYEPSNWVGGRPPQSGDSMIVPGPSVAAAWPRVPPDITLHTVVLDYGASLEVEVLGRMRNCVAG